MKKRWKYGSHPAMNNKALATTKISSPYQRVGSKDRSVKKQIVSIYKLCAFLSLPLAYCLLFITSCNIRDEHNHVPTNHPIDLDGLIQPSNQTVFSDVKTILPVQQTYDPIVNATGIITYDPALLNNISARFGGRIEKLYVRFNFEKVSKGQRIMDIYSPEILTAQQNLIYLLSNSPHDVMMINSSKQKLQLLGLTAAQIEKIVINKKPINPIPVYSPYGGHIHDIGAREGLISSSSGRGDRMDGMNNSASSSTQGQIENLPASQNSVLTIKEGMYVQSGQPLFDIYNTSRVWAILNIFPQDAVLIRKGDKVSITAETNPSNTIFATIGYIEPVVGPNASTIKVRVYLQNAENLHLKIGTFLSAKITSAKINGWWLPRKAVVNLGQKQIVFLKANDHFITQTIQTGITTDSLIQIISGLKGDEEVADNAQFMIDSESFINSDENKQ